MSFTVSATTALREVSYQRGSLIGALEQGLVLLGAGMADVRIVDSHGRVHTPAELCRKLLTAPAETMAASVAVPASVLAA